MIVRRLSAVLLPLGAGAAALGTAAVVGIDRIHLPPEAVRAIAAALPAAVLVLGVVLLALGALLGRVAHHEAQDCGSVGARTTAPPALGGGAPLPTRPSAATRVGRATPARPAAALSR
jgi:hypothetical protein